MHASVDQSCMIQATTCRLCDHKSIIVVKRNCFAAYLIFSCVKLKAKRSLLNRYTEEAIRSRNVVQLILNQLPQSFRKAKIILQKTITGSSATCKDSIQRT